MDPSPNSSPTTGPWARWKERLRQLFAGESRRQLLISISSLAGSGLIAVALRFIGGIIQGRFIGPEILGYYNKFTILPGFMFFLHLGVFTSLARQYPYFLGKGDRESALTYAGNALGWTHLLCIVHGVVFLVPCLWALWQGDHYAALGWGTQVLASTVSIYMVYLGSTYRNSSEFVVWSKASILSAVASLVFLPLVAIYKFPGLCARSSLPNFISMLYAHRKRPLKIRRQLNPSILKKMIVFGAPLMVFAYISTSLWDAVERAYILKMIDERALGVFVFAGTLCVALTTVATSISQVFHPRIAMLYGSSGKSMSASFRYCIKCSLVALATMLPLVLLTFWLIDPLVRWLLPNYVESIPIARSLCWLSLIPVIDFPRQLLIVAKRTRVFGISVMAGFLLFVVFMVFLYFRDSQVSLQTVVVATVSCKFLSVFISNGFAWREARSAPAGHSSG